MIYILKSISFTTYLLSIIINGNYLKYLLGFNFLIQLIDICRSNNKFLLFDSLILIMFLPLLYALYFQKSILQFIMIFITKIFLDFIWSESRTSISYDWIISTMNAAVIIFNPQLNVFFNFNFPIIKVLLASIGISFGIIIPFARYINFSEWEHPNLLRVYNYYTGLKLVPFLKPVYIIIHFIYEMFFDKILEGAIFFVYYRDFFKLAGFVPELIISNLVYSLSQTFSLYESNSFRIKYFTVCTIVCAIFQFIFYYFNYNLIPVSIFHATIFMIKYFLFYKTSEVYLKTGVKND